MLSKLRSTLVVVAFAAAAAFAAPAAAQSLISYDSQPGDAIGNGHSRTFTGGINSSLNYFQDSLSVSAYEYDSTNYSYDSVNISVHLPYGQQFVPGKYVTTTGNDWWNHWNQVRFSISTGRGGYCYTGQAAEFEIREAKLGPNTYIETFEMSYVARCIGSTETISGTVSIRNPAPPPALTLQFQVVDKGSVDRGNGRASFKAMAQCSTDASFHIYGSATQPNTKFTLTRGQLYGSFHCTTTPTEITLYAYADNGKFEPGSVLIDVFASGYDWLYYRSVSQHHNSVGHLIPAKKNGE